MTDDQLDALLHGLCVDLGFCLGPEAYDRIYASHPDDPEAFARLIYREEGMAIDEASGLFAAVISRVARVSAPQALTTPQAGG